MESEVAPPEVHYTVSCGGTRTSYNAPSWDDFPEHGALHEQVRALQKEVNALKDLMNGSGGWWLRRRLTSYLRTRYG